MAGTARGRPPHPPFTLTPMAELRLEEIVALCKRRGFIFPASEIYGGFANTYDYGHYGVLLKNNVKNEWWRAMLQERDDIVALDSAIIQNPGSGRPRDTSRASATRSSSASASARSAGARTTFGRSSSEPRTRRARS